MTSPFNSGLLHTLPRPKDWILGGLSGIPREKLLSDGDWRPYRDAHEMQHFPGFDTMSCVPFAALNTLEALMQMKYEEDVNWSDRALAVMSGTTKQGNYLPTVAETIRTMGIVPESSWPYYPELKTWEDYHQAVSREVIIEAARWLEDWKFLWEWVYPDHGMGYREALKLSPIQIHMEYASESWKGDDGVYRHQGANPNYTNHSATLLCIDGDGFKYVQDHYGMPVKKLAPDYPLPSGLRFHIERKFGPDPDPNPEPMPVPFPFKEGFRYFVADGGGHTLFFLANKLRHDDLAKCLDQWIGRNNGNMEGKSLTITIKELEGVKIYDLKDNETTL